MDKIAALWCRVSDPKQEEPSLDRQVAEMKKFAQEQGYTVPEDKIIKVVWTSKKILDCPEMLRLGQRGVWLVYHRHRPVCGWQPVPVQYQYLNLECQPIF